jgi:hypothetical protein
MKDHIMLVSLIWVASFVILQVTDIALAKYTTLERAQELDKSHIGARRLAYVLHTIAWVAMGLLFMLGLMGLSGLLA